VAGFDEGTLWKFKHEVMERFQGECLATLGLSTVSTVLESSPDKRLGNTSNIAWQFQYIGSDC
jgi:hypothetical protein